MKLNSTKMKVGVTAVALVLTLGALGEVSGAPAGAVEARRQNWNRYDFLLTSNETQNAASGIGGATWVCGNLIGSNPWMAIITVGSCVPLVSVCAIRARRYGQRAGITYAPFSYKAWCWRY